MGEVEKVLRKSSRAKEIIQRSGVATFTVEKLKAGTVIEVVDESRTISAEARRFTDEFAELAEHVYRFKR